MDDIQKKYKNVQCLNQTEVVAGMPVIAQFESDRVMYRASVLDVQGSDIIIQFVDFGNKAKVTKVWPLCKSFMELPQQAVCCSISSVCSVEEFWESVDKFSSIFDREKFDCKFVALDTNNV